MESLPQLLLNITNAHFSDAWNTISVVSATFSATLIAYSVFKFVYFVGYRGYDLKRFIL